MERYKIDIYPYRGGYGDIPMIALSVRVPYRNLWGRLCSKYVEAFVTMAHLFKDVPEEQALKIMIQLWKKQQKLKRQNRQ